MALRTETQKQRVYDRRLAKRSRRVWGRRLTNIFIPFHLLVMTVWLLPYNVPLVQTLVPPEGGGWVRDYVVWTGFEQSWQMFSPDPDTRDLTITAQVTLRDGRVVSYLFPRMRDMTLGEKYRRERMRKYLEIANYKETLWPPMAVYAARRCNTIPGDPPVRVALIRTIRDVPPPGKTPGPYTHEKFYQSVIAPQELR